MNIPEDLKYTKEHEWIKVEGNTVVVGITDFAQKELGDIVFTELCEAGTTLLTQKSFGVVESLKTVSELYAPVSGTVTKKNDLLDEAPETVNTSPYEDGWMIKIEIADKKDLEPLLTAKEYGEYVKNL